MGKGVFFALPYGFPGYLVVQVLHSSLNVLSYLGCHDAGFGRGHIEAHDEVVKNVRIAPEAGFALVRRHFC